MSEMQIQMPKPSMFHIILLFVMMLVALVFVFIEIKNVKRSLSQTEDRVNSVVANMPQNTTPSDEIAVEDTQYPIVQEENNEEDDIPTEDLEELVNEIEKEDEEEQTEADKTNENEDESKESNDMDSTRKQLESLSVSKLRNILENYVDNVPRNKRKKELIEDIMSHKINDNEYEQQHDMSVQDE